MCCPDINIEDVALSNYDRRDCRKYCIYIHAMFSSLGFKVFKAQVLGPRVLGFGLLGFWGFRDFGFMA